MPDLCIGVIVGILATLITAGPILFLWGYHVAMRRAISEIRQAGRSVGVYYDKHRMADRSWIEKYRKNPKE